MSPSIRFSGTNGLSLRNNLSPSSVKPSGHSSSDGALTAFQYLLQWSDAALSSDQSSVSTDLTSSTVATIHCSRVSSRIAWLRAPRNLARSVRFAITTKHLTPSCSMAFSISMMRLASSVSSASPWLDMSIQALPAG